MTRATRATRVRALPVVDQMDRAGERVVLLEGRALRVVGLAPVILDLAADGCDVVDLLAGLEERFGPAPEGDGERAARAAVDDLVEAGLLEVVRV